MLSINQNPSCKRNLSFKILTLDLRLLNSNDKDKVEDSFEKAFPVILDWSKGDNLCIAGEKDSDSDIDPDKLVIRRKNGETYSAYSVEVPIKNSDGTYCTSSDIKVGVTKFLTTYPGKKEFNFCPININHKNPYIYN